MGCGASSSKSTYEMQMNPGDDEIPVEVVNEHYQPYEFPIQPIITTRTQQLVVESWQEIVRCEYDSDRTASGKMTGASYFYTIFFDQLIVRFQDFERIFPTIKARADIISKVMSLCTSIRVEDLDLYKTRLRSLGAKHISIVHDPWLFGIYATTVLNTIRTCLGTKANDEIMGAWLHLLSFVLRNMLPEYFRRSAPFLKLHEGVVCAASSMNEQAREELRTMAKKDKAEKSKKSKTHVTGNVSRIGTQASRTSVVREPSSKVDNHIQEIQA